MHINVHDILVESVGYSRAYKILGERPSLEAVKLTAEIEGEITIARLNSSLLVRGQISTEIELECHRCLRTFNRPTQVSFQQTYAEDPRDDDLPIEDNKLDLAPLIEQEIILHLPIKILCRSDCPGIPLPDSKYTKEETGLRLQDQARITKGTQRGRT